MNDAEFVFYLKEVARAAQLPPDSLARKLERFYAGQRKHKDTAQDWDRPECDLLSQAREEGDDEWQYLSRHVFKNGDNSRDFQMIFMLLAVVEQLIDRRMFAQAAEQGLPSIDMREAATSATGADGQPARSTMEVYGIMADSESELLDGKK